MADNPPLSCSKTPSWTTSTPVISSSVTNNGTPTATGIKRVSLTNRVTFRTVSVTGTPIRSRISGHCSEMSNPHPKGVKPTSFRKNDFAPAVSLKNFVPFPSSSNASQRQFERFKVIAASQHGAISAIVGVMLSLDVTLRQM